jgi:hypothetical protein
VLGGAGGVPHAASAGRLDRSVNRHQKRVIEPGTCSSRSIVRRLSITTHRRL